MANTNTPYQQRTTADVVPGPPKKLNLRRIIQQKLGSVSTRR